MGYYVNLFNTLRTASVDCGYPENVTNGTVDVSIPSVTAWYTCDEGFMLNGTRYRTCGLDGRWSGTTPTCEGETPFEIPHVVVMVKQKSNGS